MLSKCANPECSELFLRLGQGKIFRLTPSPAVQAAAANLGSLHERFWLCDLCSKKLTIIWGGSSAKVVPLPKKPEKILAFELPPQKTPHRAQYLAPWMRAACAGREDY